jgi:uncharacterized protein (TIGR03435 family)
MVRRNALANAPNILAKVLRGTPRDKARKLVAGWALLVAVILVCVASGLGASGPSELVWVDAPLAQGTAAPPPAFEVASVRRNRSKEDSSTRVTPNRLVFRDMMAYFFIEFAYGEDLGELGFRNLRDKQLVGAPDWIWEEEYDIEAKVDDTMAEKFGKDCGKAFFHGSCSYRQAMLQMLQGLLADRFKLQVRRTTTQGSIYALVVDKGGPKMMPAAKGAGANSGQEPPRRPPCPGGLVCEEGDISMNQMADWLSRLSDVGRPVIDKTGLKGAYSVRIEFSRVQLDSANPGGVVGASIFTALKEQLGLKLEPTKGQIDGLVIEHIQRPSEN